MGRGHAQSTLFKRVATAVVLIPPFVWLVIAAPTSLLALFLAITVLGAAWEWGGLMGWLTTTARWTYVAILVPVLYFAKVLIATPAAVHILLMVAVIWWVAALVRIIGYQYGRRVPIVRSTLGRALMGVVILVPAWVALVFLHASHEYGRYLVLFLFCLIWVADSGAYFVGRAFGSHRLASEVSPGKSWEGVIGGLLSVAILAWAVTRVLPMEGGSIVLFVLLCLATAAISVIGDLTESLFKRQAGVKDSGQLLPGHGGVLDRIDSIAAAAPLFVLGLSWVGAMK